MTVSSFPTLVLSSVHNGLDAFNNISKEPMSVETMVGDCTMGRERNYFVSSGAAFDAAVSVSGVGREQPNAENYRLYAA